MSFLWVRERWLFHWFEYLDENLSNVISSLQLSLSCRWSHYHHETQVMINSNHHFTVCQATLPLVSKSSVDYDSKCPWLLLVSNESCPQTNQQLFLSYWSVLGFCFRLLHDCPFACVVSTLVPGITGIDGIISLFLCFQYFVLCHWWLMVQFRFDYLAGFSRICTLCIITLWLIWHKSVWENHVSHTSGCTISWAVHYASPLQFEHFPTSFSCLYQVFPIVLLPSYPPLHFCILLTRSSHFKCSLRPYLRDWF